jgi:hypothetical protein
VTTRELHRSLCWQIYYLVGSAIVLTGGITCLGKSELLLIGLYFVSCVAMVIYRMRQLFNKIEAQS